MAPSFERTSSRNLRGKESDRVVQSQAVEAMKTIEAAPLIQGFGNTLKNVGESFDFFTVGVVVIAGGSGRGGDVGKGFRTRVGDVFCARAAGLWVHIAGQFEYLVSGGLCESELAVHVLDSRRRLVFGGIGSIAILFDVEGVLRNGKARARKVETDFGLGGGSDVGGRLRVKKRA